MSVKGSDIAKFAKQWTGTKFSYGGTSLTSGSDSSGFVQGIYKQMGIPIPRLSYDQINEGSRISQGDLLPGDLVFFDTDEQRNGPDHVGIYLGEGKFIHNPDAGKTSQVDDLYKGDYASRFMTGRRPTGVAGSGVDSDDERLFSRTRTDPAELAARYGYSFSFLNSHPELKSLVATAVEEDWDASRFKNEAMNTEWWQNTSEPARQAQMESDRDPATFAMKVDAQTMKVRMLANEIGAIVPESVLSRIGEEVVRTGMPEEQLQSMLSDYITFTEEGTLGGKAGQAQFKLKQLAYMNGVEMSDDAIMNYAQRTAAGVSTIEQAEQQIRNSAMSMFPNYAEQIQAGVNMIDVASPYIQTLAKQLELNPADITLGDPRIKDALNGLDSEGNPSGITFTDFENRIRKSPEWLKTNGARDKLMGAGNAVLKDMGLV
jgi:hypothetical protein